MKVACVSDLHGNLPDIKGLDFDLLLIGGDICHGSKTHFSYEIDRITKWLDKEFRNWLEELKRPVVAVAGNHDLLFEKLPYEVPNLPWTYLEDNGTEFQGIKIWGTPWQKRFHNWAFNADEWFLKEQWDQIPNDTDLVLLHGPPHKYGDYSVYSREHVGSPSLTTRIKQIKPKLVVYGHIHSGYGQYKIGESVLVNASLLNEEYEVANPVVVVEI